MIRHLRHLLTTHRANTAAFLAHLDARRPDVTRDLGVLPRRSR